MVSGKKEEQANEGSAEHGHVEPPEVAPARVECHWAGDDGANLSRLANCLDLSLATYHQRTEISGEIESVVRSSLVQEHNVCNDGWLSRLQIVSVNE
jgi:hypothetical protein